MHEFDHTRYYQQAALSAEILRISCCLTDVDSEGTSTVHVLSVSTLPLSFLLRTHCTHQPRHSKYFTSADNSRLNRQASEGSSEYVLEASPIRSISMLMKIGFLYSLILLCLLHLIYDETHQCLLWLWIKSTDVYCYWNERQKTAPSSLQGHPPKYDRECCALLVCDKWLFWELRKLQSGRAHSSHSGLKYRWFSAHAGFGAWWWAG